MSLLCLTPADDAALPSSREDAPRGTRVCVFGLGGQRFALPVTGVREVMVVEQFTPVPGAAPCVLGAANLRGSLITLVSVERLLGVRARDRRLTRALVLTHPTMRVAIAVDEVLDMTALESAGPLTMLDAATMIAALKGQEER